MAEDTPTSPGCSSSTSSTVAAEARTAPTSGPSDVSSERLALAPAELRALLGTLPAQERRVLLRDLLLYAPWQQIFEAIDEQDLVRELPNLDLASAMAGRWERYLRRRTPPAAATLD